MGAAVVPQGVCRGDTFSVRVVCSAMRDGCDGGVAGIFTSLLGMYESDVWVSASERVCDRTAIYGKFVDRARDDTRIYVFKETK